MSCGASEASVRRISASMSPPPTRRLGVTAAAGCARARSGRRPRPGSRPARPLRAAGPVQGLRVAGGGGRLAVLAQLKADTLGVPVTRLEADTAATGAALLAAVAAGLAPRAQASIGALVTKAPIARPTAWWTEVADTRAAWFERVRHEPAVHDWRSR